MPVARVFLSALMLVGCVRCVIAAEPAARELVSPETVLLVEINRPLELINNPLGSDVWNLVRDSAGVKQAQTSPGFERFRQAAKFIERSLGVDWQTGVGRLTAGGIVIALQPERPKSEPAVTAIVTAADEETLKQFIDAVQAEIRRAASLAGSSTPENDKANARKAIDPEATSYRSFPCHRVGDGHFSVVGRRLVVSNTKAGLEAALDRLAGASTSKAFDPPASLRMVDAAGHVPAILATANLKLIREDPNTKPPLTLPANDPIPVVLLGGYLDLFRRADFAAAALFVEGPAHELKIRFPVGSDGAYAGLRGYFASETTESAPPLLRPTGTIFTAGWFRDYKKMWDARSDLFNPDLVKKLEADNAKAQSEGAKIGLADIVQLLGPHFRVVAARPQEPVYSIKLDERLPAFAAVISVRDEPAFRQRVLPAVESLLWLGVASSNLGEIKPSDYRGAKISTVRFTEKPDVTDPAKLGLYNFDPSYSVTDGQLIVGSTSQIVRDLIDELKRQAENPETAAPGPEHPTDRQQLSLAELGEFLKGFHSRFVRDAVLKHGLSPAEAENEIAVFQQLLKRLGSVTASNVIAPDHFDLNLRVGPAEETP